MVRKVEDTLDQAIENVRAGRSSIDDALTTRPEVRAELEPLLRLAMAIGAPTESAPSPSFRVAARARLMQEANKYYVTKPNPGRMAWVRNPFRAWRLGMSGMATALALALALVLGGGGVWAAQDALPGDPLHGVKLAAERVQLATASSTRQRAQWYVDAAGERMGEAVGILDRDRDRNRLSQQSALEAEQLLMEASAVASRMSADDGQAVARERIQAAFARLDAVLARVQPSAPAEAEPALTQARERVQEQLRVMETRNSPSEPEPQLPEPAQNRHEVGAQPVVGPQPTEAPSFGPGPGPRAGAPEGKPAGPAVAPSATVEPVRSGTATPQQEQTQQQAGEQSQQQTQQQAGEQTQQQSQQQVGEQTQQQQGQTQDPAQEQNQEQNQAQNQGEEQQATEQNQEQNQEPVQDQEQSQQQSGEQAGTGTGGPTSETSPVPSPEPAPAPSPEPAPAPNPEPSPAPEQGAGSQPGPAPDPEPEPSPEPEPQPGPGSPSGPSQGS